MNTAADNAVALFDSGRNCAQSVLLTFCEKYGLPADTAAHMSNPLGGGARCGELCGALSGAVLVVGLRCGDLGREECAAKTHEVVEAFRARFGLLRCVQLTENVSKEEKHAHCRQFVRGAAEILEQLGY